MFTVKFHSRYYGIVIRQIDIIIHLIRHHLDRGRYQYVIYTQQAISCIVGVGEAIRHSRKSIVEVACNTVVGVGERYIVEVTTDDCSVWRLFCMAIF